MSSIVDRIRKLQMSIGLSNNEFADLLGISPATLSHIYNGRNAPSMTIIEAIYNKFPNVNFNFLIKGKGNLLESNEAINISNNLNKNNLQTPSNMELLKDKTFLTEDSVDDDQKNPSSETAIPQNSNDFTNENTQNKFTIVKIGLFTSDGKVIFYTPTKDFQF